MLCHYNLSNQNENEIKFRQNVTSLSRVTSSFRHNVTYLQELKKSGSYHRDHKNVAVCFASIVNFLDFFDAKWRHGLYLYWLHFLLYLIHEQSVESDPVIIPDKVINRIFTISYDIITRSLSAMVLRVRYILNVTYLLLTRDYCRSKLNALTCANQNRKAF